MRIDGIAAVPGAERIKNGVAPRMALMRGRKLMGEQEIGADRHRQTGSQVKTSAERCSG
jgi:hypothetical protein